jgi:hypothetical protein
MEVLGSEAVAVTFAAKSFGVFAFLIPSKLTNSSSITEKLNFYKFL